MEIAIVGPEESKWTEEQKKKAKDFISNLFYKNMKEYTFEEHNYNGFLGLKHKYDYSNVVLISGHCPKGGVDIWAEEIANSLGIEKDIKKPDIETWFDGSECLCCGEILKTTNEDKITKHTKEREGDWNNTKILKGYRSRNIEIAEACDVLYCIVPSRPKYDPEYVKEYSQSFCKHCKQWGHPSNGGCWTMKYAKNLGKETHLVVIE